MPIPVKQKQMIAKVDVLICGVCNKESLIAYIPSDPVEGGKRIIADKRCKHIVGTPNMGYSCITMAEFNYIYNYARA